MSGKLYVMGAPRYIFDGLHPELQQRIEYVSSFLNFPKSKWKQITRYLVVGRIPLPKQVLYLWFSAQELNHLLQADAYDRILLYECCNVRALRTIKTLLPKQTVCYIYYCNPIHTIFRQPEKQLKQIHQLGFRLSSFDPHDASKYHLDSAGQYFCYPHDDNTPPAPSSDCFFCGLPKDREEDLLLLRQTMEAGGLKCNFIIPKLPAEKITYPEYLRQLSASRCVVDICQQNQTGLTRRPLEALFYQKKLITNNPHIKEYNFYNPANILILQETPNIRQIKEFMARPMAEIPESIRRQYDINQWIDQFLH